MRIARLQVAMELDLGVRGILVAGVHDVVLGVVLQRRHIATVVRCAVAILAR